MLKRLFTSNTRIKLLTVFLMNPDEEFFIRELTRKLDEQINSVRRELDNLKKMGLLKAKMKNRKKYYMVNEDFPIVEELRSIIAKATSGVEHIVREIKKMGDAKVLLFSGQFTNRPTETVDILVVGNLNKDHLSQYLNSDLRTTRPVNFTLMNEEDYNYRQSCRDKFLMDLLNDSKNLVPINKIS